VATVTGSLGAAGADLVLYYCAAGREPVPGGFAGADGSFSFEVPVTDGQDGVVVAHGRSSDSPLAIARAHIQEAQTTTVTGLVPTLPDGTFQPPTVPAGLVPGGSGLVLLDGTSSTPLRVDLVGFPGTAVPRYPLPGFTLAGNFEAERPDRLAGSAVLTSGGTTASFLLPPELTNVPAVLAANMLLSWPAVPGATLYTLRLQRFGDALPIWEGASGTPRLVLPPDLPSGLADLELEVDAWAAGDVSIYSVASIRQLRVPRATATPGGRRSWTIRPSLGT
jgi:hypothetical protein